MTEESQYKSHTTNQEFATNSKLSDDTNNRDQKKIN